MPGNNRVYYACIGASQCGGSLITGAISASLSLNRNFQNIFEMEKKRPSITYANSAPDIEFSYTKYLTNFVNFIDEPLINNFGGFDLSIGPDMVGGSLSGGLCDNPPHSSVRCSMALLSSVKYNLPVDGFFTVEKTYNGFSKKGGSPPSGFGCGQGTVLRRQAFTGSLPGGLNTQALQNVSIDFSISRSPVEQFAARIPYALSVNFPLETTVTFEALTQSLDSYTIDSLNAFCKNPSCHKENITISICGGGSISIPEAQLSSLQYSGGEANTNSNQTLTATFKSFTISNIDALNPVNIVPSEDPCD